MTARTTRRLLALHRWCGLVVALNVFVLGVTGSILIFHDEIDRALGVVPKVAAASNEVGLARAIVLAREARPAATPVFVYREPDEHPGIVFVGVAEGSRKFADAKPIAIDRARGEVLAALDLDRTFTGVVRRLHAELFAGPLGRLLVGLVAIALLVSLFSGLVVYGPTMRRFAYGLLRRDGSSRTTLADLHKLVGITGFGWLAVVATTGLLLSAGSLVFQYYVTTELAALGAPFAKDPIVEDLSGIDRAIESAEAAEPGRRWSIVALPGSELASPRHFTVLLQGASGIEAKVLSMALVDARAPDRAEAHPLPRYVQALLVSEPLHFGNYGGLPLKIVWFLFGIGTVVLAGSGVASFARGRRARAQPPPERASVVVEEVAS
jgi:uncharacterized iron-regulated membrane protein